MPRPIGARPAAAVQLDDTYFDLQCNLDSQCLNTSQLLEFMDAAQKDGAIDTDEWRYVRRHVRLEDALNQEACSLTRWGRVHLNNLLRLVTNLRGRLQAKERAARQDGSAEPSDIRLSEVK